MAGALAQQTERKKVGLVLSGGGAKGAAHVRAIKVIEEAGIPIDYIVGTSIGALVGGMYASGYNADQIDSIFKHQDWKVLLTDAIDRKEMKLYQRQLTDNYVITAKFEKSPFEIIEGGVLKGNNIAKLFTQLTADTPDSISYDKLKIPYACVATDLITGKEVVMHSGILAESMRASMAIPGVFSPVRKGDMLLIDGGMTNNYPVDVARQMGADVIIGVDITAMPVSANKINTTQSVLMHMIDMVTTNKHTENVSSTDVFIRVDVSGYSAASFNSKAIDSLMVRGEEAARAKWDELIALRDGLGLSHPVAAPEPRDLPKNMFDVTPVASIYKESQKNSFVGVGARFDNEELARLLIGGHYQMNNKSRFSIGLEGKLGRRLSALLYSNVMIAKNLGAQLSYNFLHNDLRLYQNGNNVAIDSYNGHKVELSFTTNWRNINIKAGTEFAYYHFGDVLIHSDFYEWAEDNGDEKSLSYFFNVAFDNRDHRAFARKGLKWNVGYRFFTTDGAEFEEGGGLHIVNADFSLSLPLSPSTILTPSVSGRWISSRNTFYTQSNIIGGINRDGFYMPQQLSFAGVNYIELAKSNLFIGSLSLRQYLSTNNYIFTVANYGQSSEKLFNVDEADHMYGAALGYGYKTPVGPIELNLNWSNVTKKVGVFFNLGYMF